MRYAQQWIITADARRASLFACQRKHGGALLVNHLRSIDNPHENEHERGRPILAGGAERPGSIARSGARAAPQDVAGRRTEEEEHRRFARDVASWLADARKALGVQRVVLFAPARFLGMLRDELAGDALTDLREGELTRFDEHELAAHPAVLKAVAGG